MGYCFNPNCDSPAVNLQLSNEVMGGQNYCQSCGAKLLLKSRYFAVKLLGKGGWGRVFLAQDSYAAHQCVVKQLLPPIEIQTNPASLQTFLRLFREEAARLSELGHHPQIPTLFDYFEQGLEKVGEAKKSSDPKYLYMVQEYIQGANLLEALKQNRTFNEVQIRKLLREILPVIEQIHGRNIIHRDIKPENLMHRTSDNQLVLIDFGVAKKFTETNAGKPGTRVFTEGYAPIEQISGRALPASDLYSLGATCLHLLTGKSPQVLEQLFQGNLWWQEALNRCQVTPQLKQVLNRMLEPIAKDRYQFAHQVYQDLLPKVTVSRSHLEFVITEADLRSNSGLLTQKIELINETPFTSLKGEWFVPSDRTPWISVTPERFSTKLKNHETKVEFNLVINPEYLMSDLVYDRTLILKTNTEPIDYELKLKVQRIISFANTSDRTLPYAYLGTVFIASITISVLYSAVWLMIRDPLAGWYYRFASLLIAALITKVLFWVSSRVVKALRSLPAISFDIQAFEQKGFSKLEAIAVLLLTIVAGFSWGTIWVSNTQLSQILLMTLIISNSAFFSVLTWYFKPLRTFILRRKKHQQERKNRLLIDP